MNDSVPRSEWRGPQPRKNCLLWKNGDCHHIHAPDRFPNDRKCVVADFPIGDQIVRADEVAGIDVALGDKFVDVDRTRRFQSDVFKFFFRRLHVHIGIDLEALRDVFVGDFLAGVGIDLGLFDAMAGVPVDLIEADLFGIGSGRIQSDRTSNKGKAQKALPVGTRGLLRGRD